MKNSGQPGFVEKNLFAQGLAALHTVYQGVGYDC